jgi:hypothetical protein
MELLWQREARTGLSRYGNAESCISSLYRWFCRREGMLTLDTSLQTAREILVCTHTAMMHSSSIHALLTLRAASVVCRVATPK